MKSRYAQSQLLGFTKSIKLDGTAITNKYHLKENSMDISPELNEWLDNREKLLAGKRRFAEAGGHIMLRDDSYDPEALDEPLRTEAIQYFDKLQQEKT